MAAEIIAEEEYGIVKAKRGQKDVDGSWLVEKNNRTVQVKAWSESRVKKNSYGTFLRLKLANPPDDLLVLLVHTSEQKFAELYKGSTSEAGKPGNLNGAQVRTLNLRQMMPALPQSVQGEIDLLLEKNKTSQNIKDQSKPHSDMAPTFEIPKFQLTFKRVLRLSHVDGVFDGKPMVWFADYDKGLGRERCGISVVVQGGKNVLDCSVFTNEAFAQFWLYASKGYLVRKRDEAKDALKKGLPIGIYMMSTNNPEDAKATAAKIIAELRPPWNKSSNNR